MSIVFTCATYTNVLYIHFPDTNCCPSNYAQIVDASRHSRQPTRKKMSRQPPRKERENSHDRVPQRRNKDGKKERKKKSVTEEMRKSCPPSTWALLSIPAGRCRSLLSEKGEQPYGNEQQWLVSSTTTFFTFSRGFLCRSVHSTSFIPYAPVHIHHAFLPTHPRYIHICSADGNKNNQAHRASSTAGVCCAWL